MRHLQGKWTYLLIIYAILYIAIHLYTLSISPLPWFDETYMASIAQEFITTGNLFPKVAQVRQMDQELIYGPVYFLISGLFIKSFGLAIFPYRLTAFLSGLLVIWISTRLFKLIHHASPLLYAFIVVLSLDPFLNRSMHEGRMDLLALFFVLQASWYFLVFHQQKQLKHIVIAATLTLLALLTTPRTGFFFTAWALIWCFWLFQSWKIYLKPALLAIGIVSIGYLIWVYYAFGGVHEMLAYYGQYLMFTRLNLAETSILKQQYLLILLGFGSFIVGSFKFGKSYLNPLTMLSFVSVITFYSMVFDQGPYAVFIVPSYYLLVFSLISTFNKSFHLSRLYHE